MSDQLSAADVVKALRAATPAERKQILEALDGAPGSAYLTAATVAANVASLREGLPVLTEGMATALLSSSERQVWGVAEADVLEVLVPFVDAHWDELEGELGRLCLLCGVWGRGVLVKVRRLVNEGRRVRGAAEIAQLQALMELASAGADGEADQDAMDAEVLRAYEALLAEYAALQQGDGVGFVFGAWSASDLALLRACKRYVERHEPHLWRGDWKRLNEHLAKHLMWAKRTGLDPETRMRERQIRAERRAQPNVLFTGLRKGEPEKWGGAVKDVGGRRDDGSGVWGGGRDLGEMMRAMERWMEERAREQGIEGGERGGYRLIP